MSKLLLCCTGCSRMIFTELEISDDMTAWVSIEPQLPATSKATAKLKILSLITVNKEGIAPFKPTTCIQPKSLLHLHFKRLALINFPYTFHRLVLLHVPIYFLM